MLYHMLCESAAAAPAHTALELGHNTLNYRQLLAGVDAWSETLHNVYGVGAGTPVLVLLPNSFEFVISIFSLAKLGAIAVPVNPSFQEKELQYYVSDSGTDTIITTPATAATIEPIVKTANPRCRMLTEIRMDSNTAQPRHNQHTPHDSTFLFQYSSGSTGTPKRVVRSQFNVVTEANNFTATIKASPDDRFLTVVPLYHAHGFGNCMLAALRCGGTLVLQPSFSRKRTLNALLEKGITVFPGVPFMFSILADSPSIEKAELPSLRLAFSAGAALDENTFHGFQKKFGATIRQLYGSTETGAVSINLGEVDHDRWSSIGKPVQGVEVMLIDDASETVTPGESGEILIKSPAMTTGYAHLDELNKETFRNGYFYSGDLGMVDDEGNIFITGRKKLFINAGGNKVDPGEVENVIQTHPAVAECVVVGIKGQYSQEIVKAVVVLEENQALSEESIKALCESKLAEYKVPRIIEFRAEIPRSPLGKILRKYLQ